MTTEDHRVRAVRAEPSWGRVLLTTVELWVSRRLRQADFRRRPASGRRRRLVKPALVAAVAVIVTAVVVLAALQFAGAFTTAAARPARLVRPSHPVRPAARPVSAPAVPPSQSQAAVWIASQVSSAAIIGCYPALCASLLAHGVSASRLMPLGSAMTGVLETDVIATLPSADMKLVDRYAPALIASFGSGASRIEVRAVATGGAAAYQAALRTDLRARQSAGSQLRRNPRLRFTVADAARLAAGEVDTRLLATLASLSSQFALRVTAFSDSAPGAPLLFRGVTVVNAGSGNPAAGLAAALAMVDAQEAPYLPAHAAIVRLPGAGQPALLIEFASPSPLGLLSTVLTAEVS
jgi:hypothetical protein